MWRKTRKNLNSYRIPILFFDLYKFEAAEEIAHKIIMKTVDLNNREFNFIIMPSETHWTYLMFRSWDKYFLYKKNVCPCFFNMTVTYAFDLMIFSKVIVHDPWTISAWKMFSNTAQKYKNHRMLSRYTI